MKSDGPVKHLVVALLLAVGCYAVFYPSIEHRRTRKGPWDVTFATTNDVTFSSTNADVPLLIINQPKLAITNVQVVFVDQMVRAGKASTNMKFSIPKPVPYEVPFGTCVFMDTTFLPGTVTFELFGHEIELLPRVLVIDRQEHPWVSNNKTTVHAILNSTNRQATGP